MFKIPVEHLANGEIFNFVIESYDDAVSFITQAYEMGFRVYEIEDLERDTLRDAVAFLKAVKEGRA